jgi:hypothetical protein
MNPQKKRGLSNYIQYLNKNQSYRKHIYIKQFLKYFYIVIVYIVGLFVRYANIKKENVDILFLFPVKSSRIKLKYLLKLIAENNYSVKTITRKRKIYNLLALRFYSDFQYVSASKALEYYEALYYSKKYDCKTVVMTENYGIFPVFIKNHMPTSVNTINLSHSITASSWKYSLFYYDYYLMFGKSSLDNAKSNSNRYGNTKVLLVGSGYINKKLESVPKGKYGKGLIYFSQWIDHNYYDETIYSRDVLFEFIRDNPEVAVKIKLHPLESDGYWAKRESEYENLFIIDNYADIHQLLDEVSIVLISWSNAVIEAAIAKRPVIAIDTSGLSEKYFDIGRYFPVVDNKIRLEEAINMVNSNYDYYVEKAKEFAEFHMEYCGESVEAIKSTILNITENRKVDYITLDENFNWTENET